MYDKHHFHFNRFDELDIHLCAKHGKKNSVLLGTFFILII
jgi:hypothetical protein